MNKMKEFFDERAKNWDNRPSLKTKEFYQEFVKNYLYLNHGMRVLDLACGTGVITNQIYEITKSEVVGMDLSSEMIKVANAKNNNPDIRYVANDFYETKESGFDSIIVHNAYPHFMDKEGFKNKCYQMLNEKGYLVICHSNNKSLLNERHKNMDKDLFREINDADKEALFFKDKFKIIKTIDSDVYVIVLQKL